MAKQTILKVSGMSCSGCAANVEKALKGVTGVTSVRVDLKGGKAVIDFDPAKADERALASAVKKAGYGVG